MKFAAIYSIIVGVGMIAQWLMSYFTQQIPELVTEPYRIAFHLAGEFITAAMLIVGGMGLLRSTSWSKQVYFLATGMLFYTAIVSPGYFAQQGEWAWVWMFGAILLLGSVGVILVSKKSNA